MSYIYVTSFLENLIYTFFDYDIRIYTTWVDVTLQNKCLKQYENSKYIEHVIEVKDQWCENYNKKNTTAVLFKF